MIIVELFLPDTFQGVLMATILNPAEQLRLEISPPIKKARQLLSISDGVHIGRSLWHELDNDSLKLLLALRKRPD